MDIFELAQQGMQIQEEELIAKLEAEELASKTKIHKFDILEAINAAGKKDYGWFDRLGEDQKNFQPFMLNKWLGFLWQKDSTQKKFTYNDRLYVETLLSINKNLNSNVFSASKELFWLLACIVQDYEVPFKIDYKKPLENMAAEKYNGKVISYMANELRSSKEKIFSMIDDGLITEAMMIEIEKDLETIEPNKKKKR